MLKTKGLIFALLASAMIASAQAAPPRASPVKDGSLSLSVDVPCDMALRYAVYDTAGAWAAVFLKELPNNNDELWVDRGSGLEGPFDRIFAMSVSPDGSRIAYSAQERYRECYVFLDDRRYGPYGEASTLQFSPDSKRVAYIAYGSGSRNSHVIDGEMLGPGQRLRFFGGHRFFYENVSDGYAVVTDAGTSGPWKDVSSIVLSPDGSDIAYIARRGDGSAWVCTADGRYGPFFSASDLEFGEDGHTPVFMASVRRDDYTYWTRYAGALVVAGPFQLPRGSYGMPSVSADGERFASVVKEGVKFYIDETRGRLGPFREVRNMRYSADGSYFAAEVMSAEYDTWLYGHDHKAGPFIGQYYTQGKKALKNWSLGDGGELNVYTRNDYDFGDPDEVRRYSPGSSLYATEAYRKPDEKVEAWPYVAGIYRVSLESGTSIRCGAGTFGPYTGSIAVYASTTTGGALYAVKHDGRFGLYRNGELMLEADERSLFETDASRGDDRVIQLRFDDRYSATIAVSGGLARYLTLADSNTAAVSCFDLAGDTPVSISLEAKATEPAPDRSHH